MVRMAGFFCEIDCKWMVMSGRSRLRLQARDATQKMQTLSECMNDALHKGYRENFRMGSKGMMTEDEKVSYSPAEVSIHNFYRFEGYSDPADNAILYLIETKDKTRGILVDAYDAYADERISAFIREVEDIDKKGPHKRKAWFFPIVRYLFKKRNDPSLAGH